MKPDLESACLPTPSDSEGTDGYTRHTDPQDPPPQTLRPHDRVNLMLMLCGISALGFAVNSVFVSNIYAPIANGADVFVLDGDGPRLLTAQADADTLDATHGAWVTINLAHIRASLFGSKTTPVVRQEEDAVTTARRQAAAEFLQRQRVNRAHLERQNTPLTKRQLRRAKLRAKARRMQMEMLEELGVFSSEPVSNIYQKARNERQRRKRKPHRRKEHHILLEVHLNHR